MTTLLTPDQYMDVLLARQAEYDTHHPRVLGFPPLLTWFIRDGDEHLVDMAAIEAQTPTDTTVKRPTKPRTYRPAAYWQDRVDRLTTRMDAINGITRHDTTDPAAYGGVGVRQTPRARAKHWARIDNAAAEYVRLEKALRHAKSMLRKAREREA